MDGGKNAAIATASKNPGKAKKISETKRKIESKIPPNHPETSPKNNPTAREMVITLIPMRSEMRPPYKIRLNTQRPSASFPM